ncbi:MAG: RNA polymerase sporulation sigma factor SigK [Ruminococcus sp.]|nr:RNA polymerase sporulation sigma factor SigK [Ruminococcus sp.]
MILQILQQFLFFFLHVESGGAFRKPLSKEQEADCFQRMARGDPQAKSDLVLHNMRLVAHIIKKYYSASNDQEELISIGTIGLMKAVSSFDYTKGIRFATYASRCIENEILMHFRSQKKQADTIYMGEAIDTDKDGNQLTLMDIIDDGTNLVEQVDLSMQSRQLYQALETALTKREAEILIMRYGLYRRAPMTQREVAKKLDISRSYVSRLEKKAIAQLKEYLSTR